MAANNSPFSDTSHSGDMATLGNELAALRQDFAKLATSVSGAAESRAAGLMKNIGDGITDARSIASHRVADARTGIEHQVSANPLMAIGLAAGAGLLLGILSRRWS